MNTQKVSSNFNKTTTMSTTTPVVVNSASSSNSSNKSSGISSGVSSHMSGTSGKFTGSGLFQFYMESFFKIPKDIKNDIIYCQRTLKAYIKVHQMVLDVFQQQPDADPQQKKRILDELETEIYEINAEQSFLFLRLRRIIDEFYKMVTKNGIPSDMNATNAFISNEIVPFVNDESLEILPVTVLRRSSEEKLIEKYFEVQRDNNPPEPQPESAQCLEVIDLDDEASNVVDKIAKPQSKPRGNKREYPSTSSGISNGESLLRNLNTALAQTSLLKPMNQRIGHEMPLVDVKPKITKNPTLAELYKQQKEEKEKEAVLPVPTNVRMSRMNLTQALKRAQAAARGPIAAPPPPPPPPPPPQPVVVTQAAQTKQKAPPAKRKPRATKTARTTAVKSPVTTSSSGEQTPERGPTPPHTYWPDELEETRTKPEEYGQEMFLRIFELFTPEVKAQMQQRRSKRRRRCAQNQNYHYGTAATSGYEPEPKRKRKAFLLSPQVKKTLPAKRRQRRSADKDSESNSVPPSRSTSSSPSDKPSCNECFKDGYILEQCDECKLHYHPQCNRETDDDQSKKSQDPKDILSDPKICPTCKRNNDMLIEKELLVNKNLQNTAKELELKMSQENERREVLQKTGKTYKIQMNNLFKIVNSLKSDNNSSSATATTSTGTKSNASKAITTTENNFVIQLD